MEKAQKLFIATYGTFLNKAAQGFHMYRSIGAMRYFFRTNL